MRENNLRSEDDFRNVDDDHYTKISSDKRWADMVLILHDGRALKSAARFAQGDPDDLLTDQEISARLHLFADPVVGPEQASEIECLIGRIDTDEVWCEQLLECVFAER